MTNKNRLLSLSQTLWRRFYWWSTHRRLRQRYGKLRSCVWFGGHGIGDELLLSTVLHERHRRRETGIGVMTSQPTLFAHSPDTIHVHPLNHADGTHLPAIGIDARALGYLKATRPPDIDIPPDHHIIAELCIHAGIFGVIDLRPYVYLTTEERLEVSRPRPYVVMQSSRRGASFSLENKEWFTERFSAVADHLGNQLDIVQVGHPSDPVLPAAVDLRGKTTLRECAAVIAGSEGFIGLVGFLMHLARAVDCPAVIIYGGREHPDQSGYPCNQNLFTNMPCSPCWRRNTCDYERSCMTSISTDQVISAWDQLHSNSLDRQQLETTRVRLT